MNCSNTIYPDCDMKRWECAPSSIIANADNYYTKAQVDELIESGCSCSGVTEEEVQEMIDDAIEEVEAKIPSLDGYATEQWVLNQHYITGVDLSDYATEQWVLNQHYITGVDLSDYATEQWVLNQHYITGVDLSDYALKSDIPTSNSAFTNDMGYLTEHQPLKTINGEVISGTGNIVIEGGGGSVTVDDHIDSASTNPVENKAIYNALNGKADKSELSNVATTGDYNDLINKPIIPAAQVQSDWNQTDSTAKDFIKNKPTIPTVPTNVSSFVNDAQYITSSSATTIVENHFVCCTQAEYEQISPKQNNVLYLIHE